MRVPAILLALAFTGACSASLGDGPGDDVADAAAAVPDGAGNGTADAAPEPDVLVLPACTEGDDRLLGGPDNHCYMLFTGALQYTQARDACAALVPSAHLVVSTSQAENDFFAPLANRTPPDHLIGGN
ncbi:MAG TPA: C-type lectin domain-containing protein, partial [Kofleriaceae bacterium]|nr:C-type lectin domain-containing protein [Kofleriaceae bacterium]